MPVTNVYNIVTNDELETPLKCDLVGAKEVAEYLGMHWVSVNRCVRTGKWSHLRRKKAVIVGVKEDLDDNAR